MVGRRFRNVALGLAVTVLWLGWPVGAVIYRVVHHSATLTPAPVASVKVGEPPATLGWTVAQARAALAAHTIARLPDSPAVLDTARIRAALAGTATRVLVLPYSGIDTRTAYEKQVDSVAGHYDTHHPLVVVEGLNVELPTSSGVVAPSDMAEVGYALSTGDVTGMVLTAIDGRSRDAAPDTGTRAADPAQVTAVGDALAARQVYTAPGLPRVTATARWNDIVRGVTVRVAVLPATATDAPRTDLTTRLARRFPRDLVVVVRGLWVEMAGPDAGLARTAVNGFYGQSYRQMAEWGPAPVNLGLALAGEYGTLRANRQVVLAPRHGRDPLPLVVTWLPWIFAGTVLLLVVATLLLRRRVVRRRRARERAGAARRSRLAGALTGVAARLTALDPHTRGGPAATLLAEAAERYRTARDLVSDGGDLATAQTALDAATDRLSRAETMLAVPAGTEDDA